MKGDGHEPIDLQRFQAGDEALFAELVRLYSPRLLTQLRRYASSSAESQDLLQDVWLRAFRKRHTFAGRGSVLGWLLMVGRTVGLNALSKRARQPLTAELFETAAQVEPAGIGDEETLAQAVLMLPERQRDVVLLRLVQGKSTAETAKLMQCAEGTVKAALHQAIGKLKQSLKEHVL